MGRARAALPAAAASVGLRRAVGPPVLLRAQRGDHAGQGHRGPGHGPGGRGSSWGLVSEVPAARRAVLPIAVVLNVTPVVAIAPALVVAFGFGPAPKLIVTALICFYPILINTSVGLRSLPVPVLQVYQTMRASRLELLVHLRIPNALPYLFAALRIVAPLAIIGAVVAELTAAGSVGGLGSVITVASSMNQLAVVYAAIFVLAVMGVLLMLVITRCRASRAALARKSAPAVPACVFGYPG